MRKITTYEENAKNGRLSTQNIYRPPDGDSNQSNTAVKNSQFNDLDKLLDGSKAISFEIDEIEKSIFQDQRPIYTTTIIPSFKHLHEENEVLLRCKELRDFLRLNTINVSKTAKTHQNSQRVAYKEPQSGNCSLLKSTSDLRKINNDQLGRRQSTSFKGHKLLQESKISAPGYDTQSIRCKNGEKQRSDFETDEENQILQKQGANLMQSKPDLKRTDNEQLSPRLSMSLEPPTLSQESEISAPDNDTLSIMCNDNEMQWSDSETAKIDQDLNEIEIERSDIIDLKITNIEQLSPRQSTIFYRPTLSQESKISALDYDTQFIICTDNERTCRDSETAMEENQKSQKKVVKRIERSKNDLKITKFNELLTRQPSFVQTHKLSQVIDTSVPDSDTLSIMGSEMHLSDYESEEDEYINNLEKSDANNTVENHMQPVYKINRYIDLYGKYSQLFSKICGKHLKGECTNKYCKWQHKFPHPDIVTKKLIDFTEEEFIIEYKFLTVCYLDIRWTYIGCFWQVCRNHDKWLQLEMAIDLNIKRCPLITQVNTNLLDLLNKGGLRGCEGLLWFRSNKAHPRFQFYKSLLNSLKDLDLLKYLKILHEITLLMFKNNKTVDLECTRVILGKLNLLPFEEIILNIVENICRCTEPSVYDTVQLKKFMFQLHNIDLDIYNRFKQMKETYQKLNSNNRRGSHDEENSIGEDNIRQTERPTVNDSLNPQQPIHTANQAYGTIKKISAFKEIDTETNYSEAVKEDKKSQNFNESSNNTKDGELLTTERTPNASHSKISKKYEKLDGEADRQNMPYIYKINKHINVKGKYSEVFGIYCKYYLKSKCTSDYCKWKHEFPHPDIITKKLIEFSEEEFITEYKIFTVVYVEIMWKYVNSFWQVCRKKHNKWLQLEMSLDLNKKRYRLIKEINTDMLELLNEEGLGHCEMHRFTLT